MTDTVIYFTTVWTCLHSSKMDSTDVRTRGMTLESITLKCTQYRHCNLFRSTNTDNIDIVIYFAQQIQAVHVVWQCNPFHSNVHGIDTVVSFTQIQTV